MPYVETETKGERALWQQRLKLYVAARQGMPSFERPPEAVESQRRVPPRVSEGSWLSWCLVFRLLTSRLRENKFLLFKATQFVVLCYACLKKLKQSLSSIFHITLVVQENVHSIKESLIWQYLISHSALMGDSFQFQCMTEDSLRFWYCKTWHFKNTKPASA